MTVKEAFAALAQAIEDGRGEQEFFVAIRMSEQRWLEGKVDGIAYEDRPIDEDTYTAATATERRVSYYSRGEKESEPWRTWED